VRRSACSSLPSSSAWAVSRSRSTTRGAWCVVAAQPAISHSAGGRVRVCGRSLLTRRVAIPLQTLVMLGTAPLMGIAIAIQGKLTVTFTKKASDNSAHAVAVAEEVPLPSNCIASLASPPLTCKLCRTPGHHQLPNCPLLRRGGEGGQQIRERAPGHPQGRLCQGRHSGSQSWPHHWLVCFPLASTLS
jgi:hypothetical protein